MAAQLVLPGRPVRGGGRAAGEGLAIEVARLAELPRALQRRVVRHAAERLGAAPDFEATEALRNLALAGRAGQKCELTGGLRGERTHRELRLTGTEAGSSAGADPAPVLTIQVPGERVMPEWGIRVRISIEDSSGLKAARGDSGAFAAPLKASPDTKPESADKVVTGKYAVDESAYAVDESAVLPAVSDQRLVCRGRWAVLRPWKAGDRVRLRHSGGPRKVKEVLERMRVTGSARANWPVLELDGRIVWMQGVQLEPEPGIEVTVSALDAAGPGPAPKKETRYRSDANLSPHSPLDGCPFVLLRSTIETTAHPGGLDVLSSVRDFAFSVT